jgi:hypothetical protein
VTVPVVQDPEEAATAPWWRSGWRPWAAITVALLAVVGVVIGSRIASTRAEAAAPVTLVGVDAPAGATAACRSLMAALPDKLGDLARRATVGDASASAAWGDPAVILRCGLPDPDGLDCSAALNGVDGVYWWQQSAPGFTTYLAVDRSVRIALTVPDGSGTGPIQSASQVIGSVLPHREPCNNGQLVPATG